MICNFFPSYALFSLTHFRSYIPILDIMERYLSFFVENFTSSSGCYSLAILHKYDHGLNPCFIKRFEERKGRRLGTVGAGGKNLHVSYAFGRFVMFRGCL